MTTRVDVTNRALQAIGTRSTIAAMDEGSNEANNASLCYDTTRQELIQAAPWNFCTATITLSQLKAAPGTVENPTVSGLNWQQPTQPPPGWLYEYAYPQDCLRMIKVVPNGVAPWNGSVPLFPIVSSSPLPFWSMPGQRFQVTTDLDGNNNAFTCILANVDRAIGCYLRDITNESIWSPDFTNAMVQALGGKLAMALTGDRAVAGDAYKRANDAIMQARASDGQEGTTVMDSEPDWITRGHGIRWGGPAPYGVGFSMPWGSLFGSW